MNSPQRTSKRRIRASSSIEKPQQLSMTLSSPSQPCAPEEQAAEESEFIFAEFISDCRMSKLFDISEGESDSSDEPSVSALPKLPSPEVFTSSETSESSPVTMRLRIPYESLSPKRKISRLSRLGSRLSATRSGSLEKTAIFSLPSRTSSSLIIPPPLSPPTTARHSLLPRAPAFETSPEHRTPGPVEGESDTSEDSSFLLALLQLPPSKMFTTPELAEVSPVSKTSSHDVPSPRPTTSCMARHVSRVSPARTSELSEGESSTSEESFLRRLLLQPPSTSTPLVSRLPIFRRTSLHVPSYMHRTTLESPDSIVRSVSKTSQRSKRPSSNMFRGSIISESKKPLLATEEESSPSKMSSASDFSFVSRSSREHEIDLGRRTSTDFGTPDVAVSPAHRRSHSMKDASDSDSSQFQPSPSQLDKASTLFLLRHAEARRLPKPVAKKQPKSTVINPYAVGLAAIGEVLRSNTRLMQDLKRNEEYINKVQGKRKTCPCDVRRHPSMWTQDIITDVHNYSFLLDCQDLIVSRERVIASNSRETIVVYNVPMVQGNPWKVKAEQALRFVDVELGIGDQTAFNLLHYIQPCDRKMFLLIASNRIIGLVVAEKLEWAHRILMETVKYRDLEEKPVPVRVGINNLWVHVSMRRQHLATSLCELVGQLFYEGEVLQKKDFAFNHISNAGVAFAKLFLKTFSPPLYFGKTGRVY